MRKKDQKAIYGMVIFGLVVLVLVVKAYLVPTELSYGDSGRKLALGINEKIQVTLPAGGTMGGWTIDRYDRQMLSLVEQTENSWTFSGTSAGQCDLIIVFRGVDENGERPSPFHLDVTIF